MERLVLRRTDVYTVRGEAEPPPPPTETKTTSFGTLSTRTTPGSPTIEATDHTVEFVAEHGLMAFNGMVVFVDLYDIHGEFFSNKLSSRDYSPVPVVLGAEMVGGVGRISMRDVVFESREVTELAAGFVIRHEDSDFFRMHFETPVTLAPDSTITIEPSPDGLMTFS